MKENSILDKKSLSIIEGKRRIETLDIVFYQHNLMK